MRRTRLSGWGRSTWSLTELITDVPTDNTTFIPRGLGRSYGDCAAITGGKTLLVTGFDGIEFIGSDEVIVGSSVSLSDLLSVCLKRQLFLPVSPGTRFVTVGGAVAADVHGKNHHSSGSIGNHVLALTIRQADQVLKCSPTMRSELFWATIGGMGLTGLIIDVHLKLKSVESPFIRRYDNKVKDLDSLISKFDDVDQFHEYSVAWIDTLATGKHFGRGVVTYGSHSPKAKGLKLPEPGNSPFRISKDLPSWVLNRWSMNVFNIAWYSLHRSQRHKEFSNPYTFFYPLDSISGWNRIYGKKGFVQYQFVVPLVALESMVKILILLSKKRVPVFLSVLKKLGKSNGGFLSFPMEGYTLAVDIPANFPSLYRILDEFDEIVASVGGRVYLAKDSRLNKTFIPTMYPRVSDFRKLRQEWDLQSYINSDLSLRLQL